MSTIDWNDLWNIDNNHKQQLKDVNNWIKLKSQLNSEIHIMKIIWTLCWIHLKSFGTCHEEGAETIDDNEKIPTPLNENEEIIAKFGNRGISSVIVIQRYHHSIEWSTETFRMNSFYHTIFCLSLKKIEKKESHFLRKIWMVFISFLIIKVL